MGICPFLSKSSGLKCSLQSFDDSDRTKPSRLIATSHCLLKPVSLGNLQNVKNKKNSKRQRQRVPVPAVITSHVSNVSYDDIMLYMVK